MKTRSTQDKADLFKDQTLIPESQSSDFARPGPESASDCKGAAKTGCQNGHFKINGLHVLLDLHLRGH